MTVINTPDGIRAFQLLQWKYAIKLESKGIKVARRSVRAHACRHLGLPPRSKPDNVIARIDEILAELRP